LLEKEVERFGDGKDVKIGVLEILCAGWYCL
jgi:hypothetical protein